MQRHQLSDMKVFIEVARENGFRAAADKLNLKAGSVSEAVQRFEDRLGVRLFERSTRSVALTPIGERLYRRSLPAITDLESAILEVDELRDTVSGALRLTAPYAAGPFFLDDLVSTFIDQYPDVTVELIYDDRKVDLIEGRVDAAIRAHTLLEPETHAVSIGPELTMSILASPEYLARNGTPSTPDDIMRHDCICFGFGSAENRAPWSFIGDAGIYTMAPTPRIVVNDLRSMITYAERGLGLAYGYTIPALNSIRAGRLVEVLTDDVATLPRYSLNYPTKRHMTRRLRAFIDLAKSESVI